MWATLVFMSSSNLCSAELSVKKSFITSGRECDVLPTEPSCSPNIQFNEVIFMQTCYKEQ